jgi:hypothetical protein
MKGSKVTHVYEVVKGDMVIGVNAVSAVDTINKAAKQSDITSIVGLHVFLLGAKSKYQIL